MVVIVSQVLRILSHLLLLVTQLAREPVTELPLRYSSGGVFFILVFHLNLLITRKSILIFILISRKSIHQLVAVMDPRTTQGDSLLHLSVSKSNTLKTQVCKCAPGEIYFDERATPINQNKSQAFFEDGGQKADLFPSLAVASLLVECGAR